MANVCESSDAALVDLLRKAGPQSIADLVSATKVTATAVRQRLTRLMQNGLIEREAAKAGRGRPSHRYHLTEKGRSQGGANFGDLALVLWNEIRAVRDPGVRRGLYQRIAKSMADLYRGEMRGTTPTERMGSLVDVFAERKVPCTIDTKNELPVLTVHACPYPQLAEQDRGICATERLMFEELLGSDVRLAECRMDGDTCCKFAVTN